MEPNIEQTLDRITVHYDPKFEEGREIIYIPADENYVRILGHKIDGFESLEHFVSYLEQCDRYEVENKKLKRMWGSLRGFLMEYYKEKSNEDEIVDHGRYCVALSIYDILSKMDEIEFENE